MAIFLYPTMTPWERYQADLARPGFSHDTAQQRTVKLLDVLYRELAATPPTHRGLAARLWATIQRPNLTPITGLYLWGGVGRGKTYLVDTFYQCLPFDDKKRVHFHRFMRKVHGELKLLQGEQNPLALVARRFAETTRIVCLDEFHVADIGDAMILYGLLHGLFANGVTLVATSNTEPDRLYEGGLQRDRFLPAIDLIKTRSQVVRLDGGIDYRLRVLHRANIYHCPLDDDAEQRMAACFTQIASDQTALEKHRDNVTLEIEGRPISTRCHADGIVWFEFGEICGDGRSQNDYIELAKCFHTILISGIPILAEEQDDKARRLMSLVDELYDRNVNLIVSAQTQPTGLYAGQKLASAFSRTSSRLQEMQSQEYLAREHVP